jgi:hypothetical protein
MRTNRMVPGNLNESANSARRPRNCRSVETSDTALVVVLWQRPLVQVNGKYGGVSVLVDSHEHLPSASSCSQDSTC